MKTPSLPTQVLLVDDNINALRALEYVLDREGFQVDCAISGQIALEQLKKSSYDVVLSDLRMPEMDGMTLLGRLRQSYPELPVMIMTAHGSVENAVDAVRSGAVNYVQKPWQATEIAAQVRAAVRKQEGADQPSTEATSKDELPTGIDAIIGSSAPMVKIKSQIDTVAKKNISVIIYGESGTGKELAARALHDCSPRKDRAFVAVNCASIPETLLENELFGHVRGAYTGAHATQKGLFEEANSGTIFLDEIGDIPASIQAKLLRVLQEHEFKKIGGTRDIRVDVRILTATNKNLREAVAAGKFREDLFYRINVIPLRMPALRDRSEDIIVLANHFRVQFNHELRLSIRGFTDDAMAQTVNFPWPGNVRELRNRVKMAMVMATGPLVTATDLGFTENAGQPAFPAFRTAKEFFEREYLTKALKLCGGNVKKAAKIAGRDRSTFYDLLNKYDLTADNFREHA